MLIYGISKDVLYRMIRQGSIPSYNFGQRLIRLSRQYMDEHFKTKAGSRKRKKEALSFEPKIVTPSERSQRSSISMTAVYYRFLFFFGKHLYFPSKPFKFFLLKILLLFILMFQ